MGSGHAAELAGLGKPHLFCQSGERNTDGSEVIACVKEILRQEQHVLLTGRISFSSVGCLGKKKSRIVLTSLLLGIYWFERQRFVAQGLLRLCGGWGGGRQTAVAGGCHEHCYGHEPSMKWSNGWTKPEGEGLSKHMSAFLSLLTSSLLLWFTHSLCLSPTPAPEHLCSQ